MQEPIDQFQEQPKPQQPELILMINLGILLFYNAYAYFFNMQGLLFVWICYQLLANLGIGLALVFFKKFRMHGVYMILSFVMVLLIGFGLCVAQI
jgi:heme/copper-type cytochrome/quinol oxidase subunit 1